MPVFLRVKEMNRIYNGLAIEALTIETL